MTQVQNVNTFATEIHTFKDALQVVSCGLKSGEKIFLKVELSFRRSVSKSEISFEKSNRGPAHVEK